jgi:hypothetical protein
VAQSGLRRRTTLATTVVRKPPDKKGFGGEPVNRGSNPRGPAKKGVKCKNGFN